jgi:hypothetical protein
VGNFVKDSAMAQEKRAGPSSSGRATANSPGQGLASFSEPCREILSIVGFWIFSGGVLQLSVDERFSIHERNDLLAAVESSPFLLSGLS